MDIVTQGFLGAAVTQSVSKKEHVRKATFIGLIAGVIADADVFIRSSTDPLLSLEYHRHFTHSLFFIPIGALIAFILLWPYFRNKLPARYLYLYCFTGYLFSGFIDACTSYGTYLLWPVINTRISWHIISIIDPVFTGILIISVIFAYKTKKTRYCRYGLVFAACYLLFSLSQLNRAESSIYQLAEQRGHTIEKILVKPTIGNTLLWRSVYLFNDDFYIDAVRVGTKKHIYQGVSIKKFNRETSLSMLKMDSMLYKDIERFIDFSDGFVSQYPDKPEILGDIRYSMDPLGDTPLWGIEMNFADTSQHVKFDSYRTSSKEARQQFLNMLLGRDLDNYVN
jgi:inner membrane protein